VGGNAQGQQPEFPPESPQQPLDERVLSRELPRMLTVLIVRRTRLEPQAGHSTFNPRSYSEMLA
jgi:hypothetical protein